MHDLDPSIRCVFNLRDVAARNCLVTGNHFVKIFGFSMTEKGEVYSSDRSETKPLKWTAPEAIISGTEYNRRSLKHW